jgi:hypothetical protein
MKRHVIGVAAAVLGTMLMGGVVATQSAAAAPPPAVPTTVTLPLFGAPLTIGITTGPGGALSAVTVDPATGNTPTSASPHKVVFQSANLTDPTGDPAKVVIRSKKGGQSVSARAGSLADFIGKPGGWSGDVFGDGTTTTVAFTIAAAADGGPDITGVTATGAANVVGTVQHSSGEGDDDEGNSMSARVSITFTNAAGDQSRTLSIKVKVGTDDDGNTSAKLSVSLGRINGVAGKAVGSHTWTGLLCDNTAASIAYDVAADGTITVGTITPAGATSSANDGKTTVTFATGEQVRIKVSDHDGQMAVSVKEKIRCDSADPTFNGSVVPTTADDNNDQGDDHGGHHGGHDDDATSTTDVTTTTVA